jgi:hypothetical protein
MTAKCLVPPEETGRLRTLTRYRRHLTEERSFLGEGEGRQAHGGRHGEALRPSVVQGTPNGPSTPGRSGLNNRSFHSHLKSATFVVGDSWCR